MIALISVLPPMLTEFTWARTIFLPSGAEDFRFSLSHPSVRPSFANGPKILRRSQQKRWVSKGLAHAKKLLIGFSTHNLAQVIAADSLPVDYIAIGPVFATGSKANPDPVVGLEGVRQARRVTKKPLVAIGGITRQNCSQVKAAGADAVAVISDLLESPAKAVADFLRVLG